jgi:peptidyl-prolyl cis-trans isomerase SurA
MINRKDSKIIKLTLTFVFLFLVNASSIFGQQLAEGIAAIIGKEIVLRSEVDQMVQSYALQNKINLANNPSALKELQSNVFERLIEQKILLVKADEDTITVNDKDVDQRVEQHIKYMIEQVGSEEKLEEAFKNPIKKIRRDLRKETADRLKVDMLRRTKFANVKVGRREVEVFYNTYKDSLGDIKETVDISHILKQIKPSEESKEEAKEKLMKILEMIKNGESFEELAKKYSQDPGSASRGGDLGFTNRGDFVKEFEEVAFALNENEVSGIVETQFGFHIIQMIEKRGEKIRTRHILIQVQPTAEDGQKTYEELENIRQQIIDGASFEEMAIAESDDENVYKDKGRLGVFETKDLKIPEFKTEVSKLKVGEISHPFQTKFGYHIVLLNNRNEQRKLTLEKDWERISELALNIKIEKEYQKWIAGLKKEIPIEIRANYN